MRFRVSDKQLNRPGAVVSTEAICTPAGGKIRLNNDLRSFQSVTLSEVEIGF